MRDQPITKLDLRTTYRYFGAEVSPRVHEAGIGWQHVLAPFIESVTDEKVKVRPLNDSHSRYMAGTDNPNEPQHTNADLEVGKVGIWITCTESNLRLSFNGKGKKATGSMLLRHGGIFQGKKLNAKLVRAAELLHEAAQVYVVQERMRKIIDELVDEVQSHPALAGYEPEDRSGFGHQWRGKMFSKSLWFRLEEDGRVGTIKLNRDYFFAHCEEETNSIQQLRDQFAAWDEIVNALEAMQPRFVEYAKRYQQCKGE